MLEYLDPREEFIGRRRLRRLMESPIHCRRPGSIHRSVSSPADEMMLMSIVSCTDGYTYKFMCEMLHVARECGGRASPSPSPSQPQHGLLSFGGFCLLSGDLQQGFQVAPAQQPPRRSPRPPVSRQCSDSSRRTQGLDNKKWCSPCQVFLGGSCNPTSWRQDVAIPTLRELGISFYNPQVSQWEEALLEREHRAKSSAAVLFFVLDRRTRNVASMVEVAYVAATPRRVVLVMDTYPGPGHVIGGEVMTESEYAALSGGLHTVQDVLERRGIPVFSQLQHALACTAQMLREDLTPQQLPHAPTPHSPLGDRYEKVKAEFESRLCKAWSSSLPLSEARHVFRRVVGRDLSHYELLTIIATKRGVSPGSFSSCSELPLRSVLLSLDEVCFVVAEFGGSPQLPPSVGDSRRARDLLTSTVVTPLQRALGWPTPRRSPRHTSTDSNNKGVSSTSHNTNSSNRHHSNVSTPCTNSSKSSTTLFPMSNTPTIPTPVAALSNGTDAPSYDVYLGGVGESVEPWRKGVALPKLQRHGLKHRMPGGTPCRTHERDDREEKDDHVYPCNRDVSRSRSDICSCTTNTSSSSSINEDMANDDADVVRRQISTSSTVSSSSSMCSSSSCEHSDNCVDSSDRGARINSCYSGSSNLCFPSKKSLKRCQEDDRVSSNECNVSTCEASNAVFGNNCRSETNGRLYPSEAEAIDRCRVLLFVINSSSRCVSEMTMASHYMGLGREVVLCVQNIPDDAVVDGEKLTKAATKDYNRGRSYLTDQAGKDGVPVFSDVAEAVDCVVRKCTTSTTTAVSTSSSNISGGGGVGGGSDGGNINEGGNSGNGGER